jgi:GMP synthase-like glutamine amidotransferase
MMARVFSTATTVTPLQVWPSLIVFGSPPSMAITRARSPITPIKATSAARAGKAHAARSKSAIKLGMKPVAIFRSARTEGPGYFASYLERRSIAWKLVALDQGEIVRATRGVSSGLVFMGGPMSVNDDLPWIIPALELVRDAVRKDVPVLGHCLGGQLMSKAFGGTVRANPVKEIGWGEVRVADNGVARAWLRRPASFESFQWHGETFSIRRARTRILEGTHCAKPAFALGKHLGMQCHVEMTEELVKLGSRPGVRRCRRARRARQCRRRRRSRRIFPGGSTACTTWRAASTTLDR